MSSILKTVLPVAVLGLPVVYAQAQASINFYSKPGCEVDYTDPESLVNTIQVQGQDDSDDELSCTKVWWSNDDWPGDDNTGRKDIWVEHSGIQNGCKLMLYEMTTPDPEVSRGCVTKYVTFGDKGTCTKVTMPAQYGYSYCCGGNCGTNDVAELFPSSSKKSRSLPSLPPVSELFQPSSNSGKNDQRARDIADIKKRAPLDGLNRRDECKWVNNEDTDKPYLRYEDQYRIGPISKCSLADGCEGEIDVSYSETISQTFGAEAGIGATLFEVIGLSMSFSYSKETAEENGFSFSHKYSVPEGASGYVAWEPIAECAKGKFTGDCKEWDSDVEGEACFLKMLNGIPDGSFSNVIEYA